jgi:hypothetical protein
VWIGFWVVFVELIIRALWPRTKCKYQAITT